jgi:hypothetical protein
LKRTRVKDRKELRQRISLISYSEGKLADRDRKTGQKQKIESKLETDWWESELAGICFLRINGLQQQMKPPTPYRVGKAIVDREAIYSV